MSVQLRNLHGEFGTLISFVDRLFTGGHMIKHTMEQWNRVLRGEIEIDDVLHDDCVFWSPVLFHPQVGSELTKLYLSAASMVFPGDDKSENSESEKSSSFRYTKQVLDGNHAVLEFETMIDGLTVNGVDIISCDDDGLITEFKVMIRPLKAVEKAREQMMSVLEQINPDS